MFYLTCTMISSVDLAQYRVSRAKDWVSVDCGTSCRSILPLESQSIKWSNIDYDMTYSSRQIIILRRLHNCM